MVVDYFDVVAMASVVVVRQVNFSLNPDVTANVVVFDVFVTTKFFHLNSRCKLKSAKKQRKKVIDATSCSKSSRDSFFV